jgi:hypothetical protein
MDANWTGVTVAAWAVVTARMRRAVVERVRSMGKLLYS